MKNGKHFIGLLIVFVVIVFGVVSFVKYPNAPINMQKWVPLPVACAGYSCVTYRQWNNAIARDTSGKKPEVILSALIFDRATQMVAYYEKIRVSKAEISQTQSSIEKTIKAIPGGKNMINQAYGGDSDLYLAADGIRGVLLRSKLMALGISNPWESKYAPKITVLNIGFKWDKKNKQIIKK